MPDVSSNTIEYLWRETRDYSWASLRAALDEIFEREIISQTIYERLLWAIGKLESLRIRFPRTASELEDRINFYM